MGKKKNRPQGTPQSHQNRPVPQDHKEPERVKDGEVYSGMALGREWTINSEALDDFELMEDMAALDNGDGYRLPGALRKMLGDEQYKDAMSLLRDPDTGRVTVTKGADFFRDLLTGD